jgi:hypothetical protein
MTKDVKNVAQKELLPCKRIAAVAFRPRSPNKLKDLMLSLSPLTCKEQYGEVPAGLNPTNHSQCIRTCK